MIVGLITKFSIKARYEIFNYTGIFESNPYYNVTLCREAAGFQMENHTIDWLNHQNKSSWMIRYQCEQNFTSYIFEEYWKPRAAANPGLMFDAFLHFASLLLMLPAIYFLCRLFRKNQFTNLTDLTISCFHIAVTMTLLEITFHLGQSTFMNFFTFVEVYALPFTGIHSINTLFLISKSLDGVFMWLFTVNDVLFTLGIGAIGVMTLYGKEQVLSNKHAYLGLTMMCIALISFFCGFLRFASWRLFDGLGHLLNFLSLGLLLPIWLIWTGMSLRWVSNEQYNSLLS